MKFKLEESLEEKRFQQKSIGIIFKRIAKTILGEFVTRFSGGILWEIHEGTPIRTLK